MALIEAKFSEILLPKKIANKASWALSEVVPKWRTPHMISVGANIVNIEWSLLILLAADK